MIRNYGSDKLINANGSGKIIRDPISPHTVFYKILIYTK
jgi:hypothetical protein